MVYRERREKSAFLEAIIDIVGVMNNLNTEKLFGHIKAKYELELYQETYDVDVLRSMMYALRSAVDMLKNRKREQSHMINKLDRLGEIYEKDDNNTTKSKK
jgi:hypothetical protein